MKKMTKKLANQVVDHYIANSSELGYISDSLDALDVNVVMFYKFINDEINIDIKTRLEEATEIINFYQNEKLTKKMFDSDKYNASAVSKMLEARNKKLYEKKEVNKLEGELDKLSDEQLDDMILKLTKEINKR